MSDTESTKVKNINIDIPEYTKEHSVGNNWYKQQVNNVNTKEKPKLKGFINKNNNKVVPTGGSRRHRQKSRKTKRRRGRGRTKRRR